jgi:hypothetical protein
MSDHHRPTRFDGVGFSTGLDPLLLFTTAIGLAVFGAVAFGPHRPLTLALALPAGLVVGNWVAFLSSLLVTAVAHRPAGHKLWYLAIGPWAFSEVGGNFRRNRHYVASRFLGTAVFAPGRVGAVGDLSEPEPPLAAALAGFAASALLAALGASGTLPFALALAAGAAIRGSGTLIERFAWNHRAQIGLDSTSTLPGAMAALVASSLRGRRPREWDTEPLGTQTDSEPASAHLAAAYELLAYAALDRGDPAEARVLIAHGLAAAEHQRRHHRSSHAAASTPIYFLAAYVSAWHDRDLDAAERAFALGRDLSGTSGFPELARIAIEQLRGNSAAATGIADRLLAGRSPEERDGLDQWLMDAVREMRATAQSTPCELPPSEPRRGSTHDPLPIVLVPRNRPSQPILFDAAVCLSFATLVALASLAFDRAAWRMDTSADRLLALTVLVAVVAFLTLLRVREWRLNRSLELSPTSLSLRIGPRFVTFPWHALTTHGQLGLMPFSGSGLKLAPGQMAPRIGPTRFAGVEIDDFEPDWRHGRTGALIRRCAPHLLPAED